MAKKKRQRRTPKKSNAARQTSVDVQTEQVPSPIKISYANFDVIGIPHDEASLREMTGHFIYDKHVINYDLSQHNVELVNTIIHECLHGIVHFYGIPFGSGKAEENCVKLMANGLTSLMKDNPELFMWSLLRLCDSEKLQDALLTQLNKHANMM